MSSSAPASSSASDPDEALAARAAAGDAGALGALHARYAPLVFAIAARIAGDAAAEEVVQDVFVSVWRKGETFDPSRGSFKAWIGRVARNHALNARRGARAPGAAAAGDAGDDALRDVVADVVPADEAQWRAHRREVVRRAVGALPEAERRALSLAFFDELTHEQVAAVLGTPLGTAKTRIRHGLKRLAPALSALLVGAAVALGLTAWRAGDERASTERALRLVTSSDVVPLRLEAAPGVPPAAHGTYRARPGTALAVLTASALPPPATGARAIAWAHVAGAWVCLGVVPPPADGRSLLVTQDARLASPPDALRITSEVAPGDAPRGPVLVAWPRSP